jgi:hypothetical protein
MILSTLHRTHSLLRSARQTRPSALARMLLMMPPRRPVTQPMRAKVSRFSYLFNGFLIFILMIAFL